MFPKPTTMSQASPFIRPYTPEDWENGLHIVGRAIPPTKALSHLISLVLK